MEMTWLAEWLNSTFATFDYNILSIFHTVAEHGGFILTPCMRIITLLGEKGILMFLLAIFLMCFSKTRKIGVCILGAVCCGALITNVVLKDFICRQRPFANMMADYHSWWLFVGAPAEDGFSFPSGHVTAAMAGMTALCLTGGKKYLWIGVPYVTLIAMSRNYLMAHYPSDVLAAIVVGLVAALVAYFITKIIYLFLEKHYDLTLCRFLQDFDVRRKLVR